MKKNNKKERKVTEHIEYNNKFALIRIIKTILIFIVALLFTFFTIIVVVNLFFPTTGVGASNILDFYPQIFNYIN